SANIDRMSRLGYFLGVVSTVFLGWPTADAQIYRLSEGDGTVHFTNAPTDPRYKNLAGYSSGTSAGFLRLPPADTARFGTEIKAAAERYGVPERSEERRVGKECRSRWSTDRLEKKNNGNAWTWRSDTAAVSACGWTKYSG